MSLHHVMSWSPSIIVKLLTEKKSRGLTHCWSCHWSFFPLNFLPLSGYTYLLPSFKDNQSILLQCTTEMQQQATMPKFLVRKKQTNFQNFTCSLKTPLHYACAHISPLQHLLLGSPQLKITGDSTAVNNVSAHTDMPKTFPSVQKLRKQPVSWIETAYGETT